MARISGKDTKPEIMVRSFLFGNGFRFRKNDKRYPGKPDIVLPKYKTVIFIHGCFWHGHSCKAGKLPATNVEFWRKKILNNKKRDERNVSELKEKGWNVIIIWQCELKNRYLREKCLKELLRKVVVSFNKK
tara:strand:+ start:134 stop:526 length:393 start_codon:yes stop_codon:yes gene_type:complete